VETSYFYGKYFYNMPILDLNDPKTLKNSEWWIGANDKENWFLKQGDDWYIFRDGKLQRPKAPKSNPSSQPLIRDSNSISNWKLYGIWVLVGVLGVSLAFNVLAFILLRVLP
jgi:hypothetical protein